MSEMNMNRGSLVIGVDYGTDSCRALLVDADTGKELAVSTSLYKRWNSGLYCDPDRSQYRHHPLDYIESLSEAILALLQQIPADRIKRIRAIGIDATASTVTLTDRNGIPLALQSGFAENPDAMFLLWKDHTALAEAEEINRLAHGWATDYTSFSGGNYSLEWFWAKALHLLRRDPAIREEAYGIIELCDWLPALLTGSQKPEEVRRSRCAAGHKCLWAEQWGGYPSHDFLEKLDPQLALIGDRLPADTFTNDTAAGQISQEWAFALGLPEDLIVSVGVVDAHSAAIGAGIKPGTMVKILGTSTCDIVVVPVHVMGDRLIPGISGQVHGSVLPEMIGVEAGQSAFGDVYAWYKKLLGWVLDQFEDDPERRRACMDRIIVALSEEAAEIPYDHSGLVSLDWLNGRRNPDPAPDKKGVISGLTLATTAPEIFKSLVEATAFGSKAIFEHYKQHGLQIEEIVSVGGISQKSAFVMQILTDVLGVPVKVANTEQAGALGAAMCAAAAAELFPSLAIAQEKMRCQVSREYFPDEERHHYYNRLFREYLRLGACQDGASSFFPQL